MRPPAPPRVSRGTGRGTVGDRGTCYSWPFISRRSIVPPERSPRHRRGAAGSPGGESDAFWGPHRAGGRGSLSADADFPSAPGDPARPPSLNDDCLAAVATVGDSIRGLGRGYWCRRLIDPWSTANLVYTVSSSHFR